MAYVLGIDLSGPVNIADTAIACFRVDGHALIHEFTRAGTDDEAIRELIALVGAGDEVSVGIDSPLSYQVGGGDRPSDTELRQRLREAGLPAGTVMPPTLTKMVYLTLRGVSVARTIMLEVPLAHIVEVHPGGVMALRGAPIDAVKTFRRSLESRAGLLEWLKKQGLKKLPRDKASDHIVAAYACALGAWRWRAGDTAWVARAEPPHRPYDYAC
jgi:predicted nuclease with RNAse H fold